MSYELDLIEYQLIESLSLRIAISYEMERKRRMVYLEKLSSDSNA